MPRHRRNTNDNDDINDSEISEDGRLIVMLIEQKIDKIVAKFTEELNNRDKKIEKLEQNVTSCNRILEVWRKNSTKQTPMNNVTQ